MLEKLKYKIIKWALWKIYSNIYYSTHGGIIASSREAKKLDVTSIWMHEDRAITITLNLSDFWSDERRQRELKK